MATKLWEEAEELGIKVDKRWSEERLQQEIDAVLAGTSGAAPAADPNAGEQMIPAVAPKPEPEKPVKEVGMSKKEKTTPVKLLYDTWLEADVRTPAGEVVDLPIPKAKELIEQGKAFRADKFPGE